jgi:hypothetical protein
VVEEVVLMEQVEVELEDIENQFQVLQRGRLVH